ncbi:MAG: hypothetical protein HQL82_14745 [Magnetococcales bacterium]|nr:hypothetical protein [Magnetococcales bacterium]
MPVQRHIAEITSPRLTIHLSPTFLHHRVEVLVSILDEEATPPTCKKRLPPPQFAGRVKEDGDVFSSLPAEVWNTME